MRWVLIVVIDKHTNKTEIHKSQLLCTKQHLVLLVMFIPANSSSPLFFRCKQKSQIKKCYLVFSICYNSHLLFEQFYIVLQFFSFCILEFYMHSIIQIQRVCVCVLKLYTAVCEVGWCLNWVVCCWLCNIFLLFFFCTQIPHNFYTKCYGRHTLIKIIHKHMYGCWMCWFGWMLYDYL